MIPLTVMPDVVEVGPYEYRISQSIEDWAQHGGERMMAITETTKLLIAIRPDVEGQILKATVLHEILHAACALVGISPQGPGTVKLTEEEFTSRVDSVLLDVLQRNPLLVMWLIDTRPQDGS